MHARIGVLRANVGGRECIYHLPGDRWYGKMNMDSPSKRWFCTATDLVSSPQQLFCSFDGTAVLIRAFRSPMQVCENRGGRGHFRKQAILSPAGRWILPSGLFAPVLSDWRPLMVSIDHFRQELLVQLRRAATEGRIDILINSGELCRAIPSSSAWSASCCDAMQEELKSGDSLVLDRTNGPGMTVRYILPRD